jgi:GNAT superfamily N-acetyltransferase
MHAPTAGLELPLGVSAHVQHDALLVLRADDLDAGRGPWRDPADAAAVGRLLDRLGYESAAAQGLRQRRAVADHLGTGDVAPITSLALLRHSGHVVFLWVAPSRVERVRAPLAPQPAAGVSLSPTGDARRGGGGGTMAELLNVTLAARPLAFDASAAEPPPCVDATRHAALGLLKMGAKRLFLIPPRQPGPLRECTPLCCLDFYVLADAQRRGVGARLFAAMLEVLGARADGLAYDRPSPKLRAFLGKHYGLGAAVEVPQTNHFVVFEPIFRTGAAAGPGGGPAGRAASGSGAVPVGGVRPRLPSIKRPY